jgi:hypothetical protein
MLLDADTTWPDAAILKAPNTSDSQSGRNSNYAIFLLDSFYYKLLKFN